MIRKLLALLLTLALFCAPMASLAEALETVPPLLPIAEAVIDAIQDAAGDQDDAPEATVAPTASSESQSETEKADEIEDAETGVWNILLLGGDSRSDSSYDRTDSMIILSVDREDGSIKMTSIMRDTWVSIPGRSSKAKINAANVYGGPELAVQTVNSNFSTDIEDYVLVNMTGLVGIVDAMGGVEIEITESERKLANEYAESFWQKADHGKAYSGSRYLEKSGLVQLNGLMALSYARNRYSDSDYGRVMRQQKVLMALAKKAAAMDMTDLMKVIPNLLANVETNLNMAEITKLALKCMNSDMDAIEQFRIPADGTYESGMYGNTWCIKPNFAKNAQLLQAFIYGEEE